MKFSYEDLLSGDVIFAEGIGHFRSPRLSELRPSGIGSWVYSFYLNILSWDTEDFVKYMTAIAPHQAGVFSKSKSLTVFDMMTVQPEFRAMLNEALSFFIVEKIVWEEKDYGFINYDAEEKPIGVINRKNFDEVRDMALQMNYISLDKYIESEKLKFTNSKARELWEKAQAYLKKQSKLSKKDTHYSLGNIISKLCAAAIGYTFHNVYDLTVYQLYDAFFQYGYLRAMELNEAAFANHGGKNFNLQDWLKPIIQD